MFCLETKYMYEDYSNMIEWFQNIQNKLDSYQSNDKWRCNLSMIQNNFHFSHLKYIILLSLKLGPYINSVWSNVNRFNQRFYSIVSIDILSRCLFSAYRWWSVLGFSRQTSDHRMFFMLADMSITYFILLGVVRLLSRAWM